MTTIRKFHMNDVFKFSNINLDSLTETFNNPYYMRYLARWPDMFVVTEHPGAKFGGYMMGKAEGKDKDWHGHVSAVTVAPEYRRIGLAKRLMDFLEKVSEDLDAYFVDLFVRSSNTVAIDMYKRLGYVVYREVIEYYTGEEDAYDMRKALPRDPKGESMIPHNPFRIPPSML